MWEFLLLFPVAALEEGDTAGAQLGHSPVLEEAGAVVIFEKYHSDVLVLCIKP